MKLRIIFFLFTFWTFYFLDFPTVYAQSFSSPTFRIQWGNFNMTSGNKSSVNYKLTDTVGQNAPGQYDKTGLTLKSGFQYIYDIITSKFSFSINDLSINFGTLVPGVGVTDTNIITISTPSGKGYQVLAHENHPLQINPSVFIPDTSCDVGSTCTQTTTGTWTSASSYGFGFNAIGINSSGVATGVGTSNYFASSGTQFRHFANISASPIETSQVIMSETNPVRNHSARVTYKVNISAVQAAGKYENAIVFIAVPQY